jgi:hypothetical protein
MKHDAIDRPPLGDFRQAVLFLFVTNPGVEFIFKRNQNGERFELDTREIKKELGGVPLNNPDVMNWIRENL